MAHTNTCLPSGLWLSEVLPRSWHDILEIGFSFEVLFAGRQGPSGLHSCLFDPAFVIPWAWGFVGANN